MTDENSASAVSGPAPSVEEGPRQFIRAWAESMSQVLGQIAGSAIAVEPLSAPPAGAPAPEDSDLQVIVVAAGPLRGEMSLRIPRASAAAMAQTFLSEAQAPEAEFKPEYPEAIEELLRQVAGYVTTALKSRWGDVQFHLKSGPPPSWSPGASGWLASVGEAPLNIGIEWQLSAALHAALPVASPSVQNPASESGVPRATIEPPAHGGIVEQNLGLLMDVGLEVMLRFGERKMVLREILELGAGAVVELDRQVDEPVDLLLDGKVIARGEVVVVDGNYGLRVLELLLPQMAS